jgi:hypothetical protein
MLNWLLLFIPAAVLLEHVAAGGPAILHPLCRHCILIEPGPCEARSDKMKP